MITVASSLSFPPLPLASVITAVVSRRWRGALVSAAVRRAGSLSRGGNLRAGSGPPFPPRPASSPFVCVLLPPFLFFCSLSHQALGSTRK